MIFTWDNPSNSTHLIEWQAFLSFIEFWNVFLCMFQKTTFNGEKDRGNISWKVVIQNNTSDSAVPFSTGNRNRLPS
jgi:hypothetical protein